MAAKRASMRRSISSGRPREPDLGDAGGRVGLEPGPELGEGPAGAERDLEGAHHPPAVGRLHAGRPDRVELGQPGVQVGRLGAAVVELGLERGGHLGVAARDVEVVDHGAQVQAGAPDEQGMVPAPRRCPPAPRVPPAGTG